MIFSFGHRRKFKKFRIKNNLKESIEPEEIFLDASKTPELEDRRLEVPIRPKTFRIFLVLIILVFLTLLSQAGYMQFVKGKEYIRLAERNRTRSFPILAPRGIIYDNSLKPLVYNIPSFDLVLTPQDLPSSSGARNRVLEKTAEILGISFNEIADRIKEVDLSFVQNISLAANLDHEKVLLLEAALNDLPGLRIEKNTARQYIDSLSFSHVLGYLGRLSPADVKNNPDYFLTEKIGRQGVEAAYEKILRGLPGERLVETNSLGQQKRIISEEQPTAGQGLVLAIDGRLQRLLFDKISQTLASLKLKKAAAVAVNPQTGGVLALLSFPGYDNNIFSQNISSSVYARLSTDPAQPLFNRAVAGQYAPGSTIKPLIGAGALQEKVITPATKINDPGEIVLVSQYNPDIIYRFPDWKAHGVVDIYSAIAQSCDVYFYTVGGGYGNIKGMGLDRLEKYFKLFGFGNVLGIDLPGESAGLVPNDSWKQAVKNERWYTGDTYHISIGQGDLLVTPLQLAVATAAVANGGRVIEPHLVDKTVDSDKNIIKSVQSEILDQNFISQANLEVIKKAMRLAVTSGSASQLNNLPVAVAAKTGTAQVAGQNETNSWASLFAPFDKPEIALVILVEDAGEGSEVAIPIARDVLAEYFK